MNFFLYIEFNQIKFIYLLRAPCPFKWTGIQKGQNWLKNRILNIWAKSESNLLNFKTFCQKLTRILIICASFWWIIFVLLRKNENFQISQNIEAQWIQNFCFLTVNSSQNMLKCLVKSPNFCLNWKKLQLQNLPFIQNFWKIFVHYNGQGALISWKLKIYILF